MKFSKTYEPNQYEPDIYALWETSKSFQPTTDPKKDPYTIVMPPPNANGNLHIGHGLTIALEDILTRYHRLRGDNTWYIPGADHAGFETWVVYERKLSAEGKSRFDYTRDELYSKVWDFVSEQRGNMELQLRALGASCDWSSLTFTLDPKVIDTVYSTFEKLLNDNLVYRGEKLVNFCVNHQTAFADIEVVHKEDKGKLWDIAYPLVEPQGDQKEIVVSTTRPETMLGDTAVAVNPEDARYKDIIGKKVKLPLTDREIPIIADEHADLTFGTGAVKITPAHDPNDYEVAGRHNLPLITVIGFDGKMTAAAGANYEGLTTTEARKKVLNNLREQDLVKREKDIVHSVGHCYKCDSVIEPLLKEQWFVKIRPLADRAIAAVESGKIRFYPASKKTALLSYLKNLKDWNISRQIPWGIPIPAFGNTTDPTDWVFDTRINLTEIEKNGSTYARDNDTFDTWFSSGQWPIITTNYLDAQNHNQNPQSEFTSVADLELKGNPEKGNVFPFRSEAHHYPTSVMETGSDLLFPWVSRMIMLGLYVTGDIPFREVYMHGMVLDEQGQKMSKSKGNVINPMEIIADYGSDALRMGLVASRSAGVNQAFSPGKVVASRNLCNKLWNISRFIQQMVDDDSDEAIAEITTTHMGEDWICRELNTTSTKLQKLLSKYRFAEASELLYDTIWNKYADWFLESQKLFRNLPLLRRTLENILIMLHPFAPFVTETIWQNLSWTSGLALTQKWPPELTTDPMSAAEFESIITIVSSLRAHFQTLPGAKKYPVLFGQDSLVDDNQLLIQFLSKAPSVTPMDAPKGLRLGIPNREIYLVIPDKILKEHQKNLEERIMSLGREIDTLTLRLSNPNYLKKAPQHLVEESQKQQAEKETLLEKMKQELTLIK